MKESNFWILLIVIALLDIKAAYFKDKFHEETIQAIEELKIKVEERTHLDSLYWEHLEKCSFIHKDSIGVGYQGYLYFKD
jgi:hypothetical protein